MPKSKTLLKPGDIVRQGRSRHDLRVLQANGDRAVLVETVNNEAGEYATFYAPSDGLKVVKDEKPAKPPADQPYDVVYVPADARADERVTIHVEASSEDDAVAKVTAQAEVSEIVSVELIKAPA